MTAARPALLLNADFQPKSYFPLSVVNWQDAVKMVYEKVAGVVAEYDDVVRSPSLVMRIPSVIALKNFVPVPKRVPFTRFNVFLRDHFRCQYCGERHLEDLTFDHVIPRSKGGDTSWQNVVAACEPCNFDKGDQLWTPRRAARQPDYHELIAAQRKFPPNYLHESWADYLYWDSEIEK